MVRDIVHHNEEVRPSDRTLKLLHRDFPQCFNAEGGFDMAAFAELLSDKVDLVKEGSGFNFLGKNYASLLAAMDTTTVLMPDEAHNQKPENRNSQNVYISGDNLDALKHLVKSYAGKVKCIYIDPPYNTGTDGFVYHDKFSFTAEELVEKLDVSEEHAQRILAMTERGAASHAAWLTFMMPRLLYAKELLSDDGAIFISIDDNEQANLKMLCDYVFGEENFVALFPWRKRTAKSDVPYGVSQDYEWILAYAQSEEFLAGIDGKNRKYYETEDFPGRAWRVHDMTTQRSGMERPNSNFTIVNPKNGKEYPANPKRTWCVTKETFDTYYAQNKIVFPGDYDFLDIDKPVFRYWKEDDMRKAGDRFGQYAVSTQFPANIGMSQDGTKDLDALFNAKVFSFPKPVNLIKYLIDGAVEKDQSEPTIIVDFFSGSASTAEAVMRLNSADDGYNLQYILVQLPEVIDENTEAYKAGFKTIDEIGQERIRRAAAKIKAETNADIDYGFRHYAIKETDDRTLENLEEFNPNALFASNMVEAFGKATVLATYAVRDGYGLTPEMEAMKFGNYEAWHCGKHLYMVDEHFDPATDDMTDLVDKFNKDHSFTVETVVLFGYSFNFNQTDLIKKNLHAIKDRSRINIDIRY